MDSNESRTDNDLDNSTNNIHSVDHDLENNNNHSSSHNSEINSDEHIPMNSELVDGQDEIIINDESSVKEEDFNTDLAACGTKDIAEHTDDAETEPCNPLCDDKEADEPRTPEPVENVEESHTDPIKCEEKTEEKVIEEVKNDHSKDISVSEDKTKVNKKFDFQTNSGSFCDVCSKMVYPMEKLMMDSKCYHKSCLKCCKCGKTLTPTVATKFNGNIFCKPHYIELFRKRGRYDDINIDTQGSHDTGGVTAVTKVAGDLGNNDNCVEPAKAAEKEVAVGSGDLARNESKVAEVSKNWAEGRAVNTPDWMQSNSSNGGTKSEELNTVNSSAMVTNLKAMFESNQ